MPSGIFTLKQQDLALTQGAWTNQPPNSVNYLVVAGGGGGGKSNGAISGAANGGGGGSGGLLQGSIGITAGTSYTVTVGSGGAGGGGSDGIGANGSSSVFGPISSTGGGGGGNSAASGGNVGQSGGSGGGSGGGATAASGGAGVSGQGNRGGANTYASSAYGTGGGGGAGTIGLDGTASVGGNGGAGVASDISGTRTTYAGGGGGSTYNGNGTAGAGGAGGGGAGSINGSTPGGAGSGNTGGGGGGGSFTVSGTVVSNGGNGGSGVVIVSYPGTTQWFTGGVVNYYNGNVIHIFYQSGTLAPTTPTPILPTYQISRSLRFNSADSAYLNRTPASATNRKTWTWSGWVKRVSSGTVQHLFRTNATPITLMRFEANDTLYFYSVGVNAELRTTPVYRDFSAWYHVIFAVDTTQATAANRIKIYVNGTQVTAFSTELYPSQNTDLGINTASAHAIGATTTPDEFANQYLTEVNFIDGQALTPSSFGETNAQTGVWQPKAYSGSYGTNGFYLNFSDNSNTTAATLGKDYSGNGNNWTPNNFSVAAGAGNDSLVDTPTPYGTADTGVGGEVRGNYCTLNPLSTTAGTYTQGNLQFVGSGAWRRSNATISVSRGQWYWEVTLANAPLSPRNSGSAWNAFGFGLATAFNSTTDPSAVTDAVVLADSGWFKNFSGSWTDGGTAFSSGDVLAIAVDLDANAFTFYRNNTRITSGTIGGTAGRELVPIIISYSNTYGVMDCNFGQRPFAYTAPSGFRALTTWNLPTPTIGATTATQAGKFFNAVTYTGNASTQNITGVGFQPDFVWTKSRANAYQHMAYDVIRGVNKFLLPNNTDSEATNGGSGGVTSFNADGFSLGSGDNSNFTNGSAAVAWNWKANGAGSSNTAGSITSTVSANTTSGFSIATWTGTGSGTATIGHGLGVAPSMIIVKFRNTTSNWSIYHASLGNTKRLTFTTAAEETDANIWNNTSPTTTVFTTGTTLNQSFTYVAYCFAAVAGYSAFGSYTGNGSTDGPFIFTGFRPAYVLIKGTSAGYIWTVYDSKRNTYNVANLFLQPQSSDAETTFVTLDFVSNGIKIRSSDTAFNGSGTTYIYACFAENPFKYSLAR